MRKTLKSIFCLLLCVLTVASLPVPALGEVISKTGGRAASAAVYTVIESNSLKAPDQQTAKAASVGNKTSSSIRTTATKSCSHKWKAVKIKDSTTYHKLVCEKCGASKKTKCAYKTAVNIKDSSKYHYLKCTCGNKKKVKCTYDKVVNIKDSSKYHYKKCACGNKKKVKCSYNKVVNIKDSSTYHYLKCTCGNKKKVKCTYKAEQLTDSTTYHKLKCTKCGNTKKQKCTWEAEQLVKSSVYHKLVCTKCGKTKKSKCTWTVEKVKGSNIGYHNLTCAKCGKTKKENCAYGTTRTPTKSGGLTAATCTQDATYYVVCKKCAGKKITTEKKLNHSKKVLVASKCKAPTCAAAGYDFYSCPQCGKDGSTVKALKVAIPALGHSPSTASDPLNEDIVCDRCKKTITPAFNTLVNQINMSATPSISYSLLSRQDSVGRLKKDSKGNEMCTITVPAAAKTLMRLAGDEEMDTDSIKEMLLSELGRSESVYSRYTMESPYLFQYYPIPQSNTVSELRKTDVTDINIQEIKNVDFMKEIHAIKDADGNETDKIKVSPGGSTAQKVDISDFKKLGDSMTGNIYKITVTLKQEKYSKIKDTTEETALQRATGIDIRTYPELFSQSEPGSEIKLDMTCKDVTSNCVITYYFLVTGSGTKTYTPLASRYVTSFDLDQHIDIEAGMAIADLGLDSALLKAFLAATGLKKGDNLVFMEGDIDMIVSNVNTDYYLFSTAA